MHVFDHGATLFHKLAATLHSSIAAESRYTMLGGDTIDIIAPLVEHLQERHLLPRSTNVTASLS
jgi:hypothetical protein